MHLDTVCYHLLLAEQCSWESLQPVEHRLRSCFLKEPGTCSLRVMCSHACNVALQDKERVVLPRRPDQSSSELLARLSIAKVMEFTSQSLRSVWTAATQYRWDCRNSDRHCCDAKSNSWVEVPPGQSCLHWDVHLAVTICPCTATILPVV